jgi:hypothetical protein
VPGAPTQSPAAPAATPAAATDKPPEAPAQATTGAAGAASPSTTPKGDSLPNAGYIPGYRQLGTLGMPPHTPRTGALPGGMTPGYGAPLPSQKWTFTWNGFMTASLQFSGNERPTTQPGQTKLVFHVPPATVDEYASFVGTNTVPGQWVQMNFIYGTPSVSANVTLTTWNPADASTYYQIGSEQFINNAYMSFSKIPIGPATLRAQLGYFYNTYGNLGAYGLGMYTNSIVGGVRGVGEDLIAESALSDSTTLALEDGFMGSRNGAAPLSIINSGQNGTGNTTWPASWIHHAHLGIERKGDLTLRARFHYIQNWAQDDRSQRQLDNVTTHQLDESYIKDGHLNVYGADFSVGSPVYGYLGFGAAYVSGHNATLLKGLTTFGGDGTDLDQRWWGQPTGGTGTLTVAGANFSTSLAKIVSYPTPFNNDGPDVVVNTGFIIAKSTSSIALYDRVRHKYGLDVLYTFLPYVGVGMRADRVVPTSKDSEETFHVLAPRLVFRTGWNSHEAITLLYAKWFYGPHTHAEASSVLQPDRRDDQLFALNVNLWW